jgi:hypothetical protein
VYYGSESTPSIVPVVFGPSERGWFSSSSISGKIRQQQQVLLAYDKLPLELLLEFPTFSVLPLLM